MSLITKFLEKIYIQICIYYIEFVYKTSKIIRTGHHEFLHIANNEKFIISFWHGNSYCFYPLLRNNRQYVIATEDRRGNYISALCKHFGYATIRVPDNSKGGNFFYKIKKQILSENRYNLIITLDGPLGPYHEPKEFPFIMALFLKYRIINMSITVRNKIPLTKRWDNYVIPLPFNKITIHANSPLEVSKKDIKEHFLLKREMTKKMMVDNSIQ